jgi:hypothetical protein
MSPDGAGDYLLRLWLSVKDSISESGVFQIAEVDFIM